jgi:hypothetical protein
MSLLRFQAALPDSPIAFAFGTYRSEQPKAFDRYFSQDPASAADSSATVCHVAP